MDKPPDELLQSHLDWTCKQGRILALSRTAHATHMQCVPAPRIGIWSVEKRHGTNVTTQILQRKP